jgi:GNAT superfamily N-acetyltransferase
VARSEAEGIPATHKLRIADVLLRVPQISADTECMGSRYALRFAPRRPAMTEHEVRGKSLRNITIKLRAATPDDAAFLGWACVMAARSQMPRGWFDVVLQREESYVLEFAIYLTITTTVSWWHWSLFQIAEVDGAVASAMCGFGDGRVYAESTAAMAEASERMRIPREVQAQFWSRGAFIVSTATSEAGAWTIENVATKPEFRGEGATDALLQRELHLARGSGFKRAQISFFIGNTRAERAYSRAGFVFAEEKRAADFEAAMGTPGTKRFARDI